MNAQEILKITEPERLFGPDRPTVEELKKRFHNLAKAWHPDQGGEASVFAHIRKLHGEAQEKLLRGVWDVPGELVLMDITGHTRVIRYDAKRKVTEGTLHIGEDRIAYTFSPAAEVLSRQFRHAGFFKFSSDRMREHVEPYLPPAPVEMFRTPTGEAALVIRKAADLILLKDAEEHFGGMDPKHTAWIMSSLFNLACYFHYAGLTHCDIAEDTVFISPKNHRIALLGGWWYATRTGSRIGWLPYRTAALLPPDVAAAKIADERIDGELIRALGRRMLEKRLQEAPGNLRSYLRNAAGVPATDYERWYRELETAYGKRTYTELPLTYADVYRKAN